MIEPPRGLARLQPGMSVSEAVRLVPELRDEHRGVRDELVMDSRVSDVRLVVRTDNGTVDRILAIVQGQNARELLTSAWGSPTITPDSLGQPEVTWASESTGWKVKLDCVERNCVIDYIPYHVLTEEFFGAHVVPPGDLARLRVGMKLAEARTIAPAPINVRAGIPTGVDGVREFVAIDDKLGTIRAIYLNLPRNAEVLIEKAWGKGNVATETGKKVLVWPDPTTGWRATLRDALGYSHDLAFDTYLPAGQLLGDQVDKLDALPEPVLGKTPDEVKKAYKDDVTVSGRDLVITLPPTEWERGSTHVVLNAGGGRVHSIAFSLPFKAHPEARDDLLELFKHKWGAPREVQSGDDDSNAKPLLLFHDEDPRVVVREDTEHGAWRIELR